MAGVFPTIKSGAACQYPVQRSVSFDTGIVPTQTGSEQRWKRRGALAGFTLTYNNLKLVDKQKLDTFITAQRGAFDSTWTFGLLPINQQQPTNGHFRQGFTGWLIQPDAFNAFTVGISAQGSSSQNASDPSEIGIVNFNNNSVALPAGGRVFTNFVSSSISCVPGQTFNISYGAIVLTNAGTLPAGSVPQLFAYISQFDGAGNRSDIILTGVSANQPWNIYQNPITITQTNCVRFTIVFSSIFSNPTGATVYCAPNTMIVLLGDVSALASPSPAVYTNCAFDADEFPWKQDRNAPLLWSGSMKFRQTLSSITGAVLTPIPVPHGDFAAGFIGWTFYSPNNAFAATYSPATATGINYLNVANLQVALPAQTRITATLGSTSPIQVQTGQTITVNFLTDLEYNVNSLTLIPGVQFGWANFQVNTYSASGAILSAIDTSWSRAYPASGGFTAGSTTFTITAPNASYIAIIFVAFVNNPTNSQMILPNDFMNVSIANVTAQVAPSAQSVFPTIQTGIITGYPYSPSYHFFTDRNDLPAGPRISYAWYGSGDTGFPNRALQGWGLSFTNVGDADLAIIESHYLACSGKYLPFSFTDPDTGVVYPHVRYDMDSLDVTHRSINAAEFKVTLVEFYA